VGAGNAKVNLIDEVSVPPGVVTVIATVVLLVPKFGTTAVIPLAEFTV
jgi:hypothetical protein